MEAKQELNPIPGVIVIDDGGDGAPDGYLVAGAVAAETANPTTQLEGPQTLAVVQPVNVAAPTNGSTKRKGRPRKYGPNGGSAAALTPMAMAAPFPLSGDFSGWKQQATATTTIPARVESTIKKAHRVESQSTGDRLSYLAGGNFTPHVLTIKAGEDVASEILSFSRHESEAICVLSATGSISNVTLRQPNSSGGTLTYESRFEILSLSGSFMPVDNGTVKSRSGGLSITLAGPDGRLLGGGLAGSLTAASPVQVVLGSFLPGQQRKGKLKKQRTEAGEGGQKLNFSASPPNHHAHPHDFEPAKNVSPDMDE